MKYNVTMRVEGRYTVCVDAGCAWEAEEKATGMWTETDFGELVDVDMEHVKVEDENGNEVCDCLIP